MSSTRPSNAAPALDQQPRAKRLRPKDARAALRAEYARVSRAGRVLADLSQSDLAAELEVAKPFVGHSELGAPDRPVPNVLHVASAACSPAARAWAAEVVRWQAAKLALVVLDQTRVQHGDDHGARLAAVTRDCTDVPRELAAALSDGVLTLDALERVEREAREGAQAALEVQSWASAEIARRREAG